MHSLTCGGQIHIQKKVVVGLLLGLFVFCLFLSFWFCFFLVFCFCFLQGVHCCLGGCVVVAVLFWVFFVCVVVLFWCSLAFTVSFLAGLLCSALPVSGVHCQTKGDMVNKWLSHGANGIIRKHKLGTPTDS